MSVGPIPRVANPCCNPFWPGQPGAADEAARIHKATGWFCGCVAACCASAAGVGNPQNRFRVYQGKGFDQCVELRSTELLSKRERLASAWILPTEAPHNSDVPADCRPPPPQAITK